MATQIWMFTAFFECPHNFLIVRFCFIHLNTLWKALHNVFRMSKFDSQARPIYHQKHDAIKAHVLICFVALMAEKYLELTTKLSLREIRFLIWNITETHIWDNLTKEVFVFRSPMNDILQSNLAGLISEWNLLPH